MALNIKNRDVERLVEEVSRMTGESKTEAVRRALADRREKLAFRTEGRRRGDRFLEYLKDTVWPEAPEGELGRRLSREEEDEILGYDSRGGA